MGGLNASSAANPMQEALYHADKYQYRENCHEQANDFTSASGFLPRGSFSSSVAAFRLENHHARRSNNNCCPRIKTLFGSKLNDTGENQYSQNDKQTAGQNRGNGKIPLSG